MLCRSRCRRFVSEQPISYPRRILHCPIWKEIGKEVPDHREEDPEDYARVRVAGKRPGVAERN